MSVKTELNYPGTISLGDPEQAYPGVKAKWFWTVNGYNRFFQEKPGKPGHAMVVVKVQPMVYLLGLMTGVLVHYTKQLSIEEEQDMIETSREIEFAMADKRAKRRAAAEEEMKLNLMVQEEMKRLAQVGQRYEDRVKHAKVQPTIKQQNDAMAVLNSGDPEVLFANKLEAFQGGYVRGYENGKEGDK